MDPKEPTNLDATTVIKQYGPAILRWVRKGVADSDVADVVQEAHILVWKNLGQLRAPEALADWLRTVVRRAVVGHYRKNRTRLSVQSEMPQDEDGEQAEFADKGPTPEQLVLAQQTEALINKALANMPERDSQVVRLRFVEGLTNHEIAKLLDINPSTVGSIVHRKKKLLADVLAASGVLGG